VLFSIMFVIGFVTSGETPDTTDSPEEILKHYDDGKLFIGIITLGVGAILFMFFAAALRKHLLATGPEWLATLSFAGAIIFVVALGGFASGQFALLSAADEKNLQVLQTLNYIDNNNFPPAVIGLSVLMLATAWHALSSRSLPTWLAWVTLVLGVLALAGPLGFLTFLATIPWTFIVGIMLYRRGSVTAAV
jgi:hypothetical protein